MEVYQIIALTNSGKLWESNLIYKSHEEAELQRKALLQDTENLCYVRIKELWLR